MVGFCHDQNFRINRTILCFGICKIGSQPQKKNNFQKSKQLKKQNFVELFDLVSIAG